MKFGLKDKYANFWCGVLLQWSSEFVTFFDKLVCMLDNLTRSLPDYKRFENLLKDQKSVFDVMVQIHVDILDICLSTIKLFRDDKARGGYSTLVWSLARCAKLTKS